MTRDLPDKPDGYDELLGELVGRIREARLGAALAINRERIGLYWRIGRDILERQERRGWGARVIDRLAVDLRRALPDARGFSVRNLKYMRALARAWPDGEFVQQLLHKLPWGHLCSIVDKLENAPEREWYARAALEHGWSRNVLVHQIESGLRGRQGAAVTNFARTLPAPQSELAHQLLKDPYHLEFLGLAEDARERDLHRALLVNLRDFLLELGIGFAFVGSEYRLPVGEREFFLDLLLYHLRLRVFVAVELKTGAFEPEHAGKLGFYLTALDQELRHAADGPSIGIILCKTKDRVVAEYALRDSTKPIGVAAYQLTRSLPSELEAELPAAEELEAELRRAR